MRGRVAEVVAVSAFAALVTMVIAAPVLRAPSERIFGAEIVGRHHDPFTVMAQFGAPVRVGVTSQPVTDVTGALLARLGGQVAAYNWLVLLSFPLSAAAACLLARHLALSPAGATFAAMAYAFSPFHVAHAAYHPHIAQTQWLPLYLLALWRCLDDPSPKAIAWLGAAAAAVSLSNFYGGLIAAVITPVAVAAYWFVTRRAGTESVRRLGVTVGALMIVAASGMLYAASVANAVLVHRTAFAFPRTDLFSHSAKWWSYLMPPVEHPLLGDTARRVWTGLGVREGLLEQQVSLGWGVIALALLAVFWRMMRHPPRAPSRACVPALVIVGVAAVVCSLSPERTIGAFTFVRPSALLYEVVPMFRAYARFGVVVQLMAALLAGIGVDYLRRGGTRRARVLCVALVTLAACEYAVSPAALWRDVLPTPAHRWVATQGDGVRAIDCTPLDQESASVQWLTGSRVMLLGDSVSDCTEPNLAQKLAAHGYTHVLVRRGMGDEPGADRRAPDGLRVAAQFDAAHVFAVTARPPALYTATMTGFFPREHNDQWTWRWMGAEAAWTIVNTGARPVVATLAVDMAAFAGARRVDVRLDGRPVQALVVEPRRRVYEVGPLTVPPGDHELLFDAIDAPTVANDVIGNGDARALSLALGGWTWVVRVDEP